MRKLFTVIVVVLLTASVFGQVPQKMSYQAVIRDTANNLVINDTVGMQISILQGSISGLSVYTEKHTAATNFNGLLTIEIGGGTVISGDFDTINWSDGTYFLKTETDLLGGNNYTISGVSQLLSVPYALHAKSADNITQGMIIAKISTIQRDAIVSPSEGLLIFNTTTKCFESFVNNTWSNVSCPGECTLPLAPTAGVNIPAQAQITWKWNPVTCVGYKWNNSDDYQTAKELGTNSSFTQTGLFYDSAYSIYIWAYNSCGISPVIILLDTTTGFICGNPYTDPRNNISYNTLQIGTQCWMKENLNYGTFVPIASNGQAPVGTQKYCQNSSGVNDSVCPFGGIYEWNEMMNGSVSCNGLDSSQPACTTPVNGICPPSWHIPSHYEWTRLEQNVGTNLGAFPYDETTSAFLGTNEGDNLKTSGNGAPPLWASPSSGNNSSGFSAFPAGYGTGGSFSSMGYQGSFWTSTESNSSLAWNRTLFSFSSAVSRYNSTNKSINLSVRCVKD